VGRENFKGIQDFATSCQASEWTAQIVASNSVAYWHLLPAIKQIQAQAKEVRFEIHHAQTREMVNAIREGIYDIAFVREDAIPAGMKRASLGSVGRSLFIPKALAPNRPKTLAAALVSIPLALPIGGSVRENAEQRAAKAGKPLKIALGCTSYLQAAQALETEAYGTVLPDLAKTSLKLERFHAFDLPEKYNLCMVWSKRNTDTRPQLLSLIGTMQGFLKLSGK
jgi:DNA-binding transcriptional LysR family regulator